MDTEIFWNTLGRFRHCRFHPIRASDDEWSGRRPLAVEPDAAHIWDMSSDDDDAIIRIAFDLPRPRQGCVN